MRDSLCAVTEAFLLVSGQIVVLEVGDAVFEAVIDEAGGELHGESLLGHALLLGAV